MQLALWPPCHKGERGPATDGGTLLYTMAGTVGALQWPRLVGTVHAQSRPTIARLYYATHPQQR